MNRDNVNPTEKLSSIRWYLHHNMFQMWKVDDVVRYICIYLYIIGDYCDCLLPGDSKKMENTITPSTAEITNKAMQMPRQFLFSDEDTTISYY